MCCPVVMNVFSSDEDIPVAIDEVLREHNVDFGTPANVLVAFDTRSSSVRLSEAVKAGVKSIGGNCFEYGLLTTPQLHFLVNYKNSGGKRDGELVYYEMLFDAFEKLVNNCSHLSRYESTLNLDCANGVGGLKFEKMLDTWQKPVRNLQVSVLNDGIDGVLNEDCGADFVKVNKMFPLNMRDLASGAKCASFDGDADRLIYFFRKGEQFVMLGGCEVEE